MDINDNATNKIIAIALMMMVKFIRKCNLMTQSGLKMYNQDKMITSSEGSDSAFSRVSNMSLRELKTCFM
jgi:hypothetical protein